MNDSRRLAVRRAARTVLVALAGVAVAAGEPLRADGESEGSALARWRRAVPGLLFERDATTGATRRLGNPVGFLVDRPAPGDAETIAREFALRERALLGLTAADLAEVERVDRVESRLSGVTHLYLRQRHEGIPVHNGLLQINVAADGRILSLGSQFLPRLATAVNRTEPAIDANGALARARAALGKVEIVADAPAPQLMFLAVAPGVARLVWNLDVATPDKRRWWNVNVDAEDGRVRSLGDRISHASYRVYEQPIEHPGYATPAPPGDGRTVAIDPPDPLASPFGWHDTDGVAGAESTLTVGNNVDAYTDTNADNLPDPDSRPDGGAALVFSQPFDLTLEPAANRPAAVANLFYWVNVVHDIEYLYGFDEVAGNFQLDNYDRGGAGGDPVRAEAQEGSGTCGGNFASGPDGSPARLQAFVCPSTTPARDGAFDHLVQIHEYGHGIATRLVGGPGNSNCLFNAEQPGEGLSDLWGLTLTATAAQSGPTPRTVGTWLFANLPNGIRPYPYSTDEAVNPVTYATTNTSPGAHGVGSVWAQIYWKAYWALVDAHGFDGDLRGVTGTGADAGNLRAKLYLNEGLKNTVCGPGFVDVRDGILAAAASLYDGVDVCPLWRAFAAVGLGENASQGSPNSAVDQVEGFAVPAACDESGIFADGFETEDTGNWSGTVP